MVENTLYLWWLKNHLLQKVSQNLYLMDPITQEEGLANSAKFMNSMALCSEKMHFSKLHQL